MTDEERLRELMQDPGWSLPPWPNAEQRIRRAARRQRAIAASLAVAMAAVITGLVLVASPLLRASSTPVATRPVHRATQRPSRPGTSPSPSPSRLTPAVGSEGFPAAIYPAAVRTRQHSSILALCPAAAGLEPPGPATPAAATAVLRELTGNFHGELQVSDRSAWPLLAHTWRAGGIRILARAARSSPRYSGPLRPGTDLTHAILGACGSQVANATWVIVAHGSRILFVTRRGHMLFYSLA